MNLVDGATTFPVPVGNDASLAKSEDAVCRMEAVGRAAVVVSVLKYMVITASNHCYQCTDNRLEGYFHPAHWQPATFQ